MTDSPKSLRRIAANVIKTTTGTIEQGVVVIEDGIVVPRPILLRGRSYDRMDNWDDNHTP